MPDFTTYTPLLPSGGGGSGSSVPPAPWYTDPYFWLQTGTSLLDTGGSIYSAGQANKTNVKLQREQRDWQEKMANSEIQRRKADYEKAGFNPALAAVQGGGASTPSVSSARVEPTFRPGGLAGLNTAAQTAANIQNVRADTLNKVASARIQNVEANIREGTSGQEFETRSNRLVEEREWDDLRTKILRSEDISSAAGAKKDREIVDDLIAMAKRDNAAGKLEYAALENFAKVGGLEAGRAQGIVKMIIDMLRPTSNRNRGR